MSLGPRHWLRIKFANSLEFFKLYEFFKRGEVLYRCSYSDDVGCHDQRNVNKNNKAFKIKLAVTMTSPEERQNQSYSTRKRWRFC